MKRNQLVSFDTGYYVFPNNIYGGYWLRAPSAIGLGSEDQIRRRTWLSRLDVNTSTRWHQRVMSLAPSSARLHLEWALREHGFFAERFFVHAARGDSLRSYSAAPIPATEFDALASQVDGTSPHFYGDQDRIRYWLEYFYDQLVVVAVQDPSIGEHLQAWFNTSSEPRCCVICERAFRLIDRPDWLYFGSNGCREVCFACPLMSPSKKDLKQLVRNFVDVCGFIPTAQSGPMDFAFGSRFAPEQLPNAFSALVAMGGMAHVKAKFGSWFEALASTGALPDGVLVTKRGVRCLARDGHVCHSLDEQRIDDWLTEHGVEHEREPLYPAHPQLNASARRRADWATRDIYIEYFGLIGDETYEKKMIEKVQLAAVSGIDLVEIYPEDLTNLGRKLGLLAR